MTVTLLLPFLLAVIAWLALRAVFAGDRQVRLTCRQLELLYLYRLTRGLRGLGYGYLGVTRAALEAAAAQERLNEQIRRDAANVSDTFGLDLLGDIR